MFEKVPETVNNGGYKVTKDKVMEKEGIGR